MSSGLPIEQFPVNSASLLSQVLVEGRDGERRESLTPLEFGDTAFEPNDATNHSAGRGRSARSDIRNTELVDPFGSGLPALLEFNDHVRYWGNLGGGRFDLMRTMETAPAGGSLERAGRATARRRRQWTS